MKMSATVFPPMLKHNAMKTYEVVKVKLHAFLTLVLDKGEWSASFLAALPSGKFPQHPLNGSHFCRILMMVC